MKGGVLAISLNYPQTISDHHHVDGNFLGVHKGEEIDIL
jgi:hypothetical protein